MRSAPVVALVACVKSKAPVRAPARSLYTSSLFRATSAYAERTADRWFILSARHGLLHPDDLVEPYEQTLHRLSAAERSAWSAKVTEALQQRLAAPAHLVVLAGSVYRERLMAPLQRAGFSMSVPMEGLRLGEQLRWLRESGASASLR
ncbi:MAG: hypothetical protein J0H86_09580 [Xanthomonadaceae bacterium]|nr:hypothetical protein [Xanthomonadaceae bacterium]